MRKGALAVVLLGLMLLAFGFETWAPEQNPVSGAGLVMTCQPFALMNSKVKDTKIMVGGLTVENTSDQPVVFDAVKLTWEKSEAPALSREEIRASLKSGSWLTGLAAPGMNGMVESSMTAYNIAGQTLPAKQKTSFTASFLIPKKTLKAYQLRICEGLSVKLSEVRNE